MNSKFLCGTCGKNFLSIGSLNKHIKYHVDDEVHKCEVCDIILKNKIQFKDHMNKVHGSTLKCDLCVYITSNSSNLKKHVQAIHGFGDTYICKY